MPYVSSWTACKQHFVERFNIPEKNFKIFENNLRSEIQGCVIELYPEFKKNHIYKSWSENNQKLYEEMMNYFWNEKYLENGKMLFYTDKKGDF